MKKIPICNIDKYKTRNCFQEAVSFLETENNRILVLYGLRRTGKTVLMKQLGSHFGIEFIYRVAPKDTMDKIYEQLDEHFNHGDKIVFIDEITNAEDFIENSALLADYYASCGMNIVITGTDSLGIFLAENNALLDRVKLINTTYISFAEHCEVLNTDSMDDYIRFGGLMSKEITKEFLYTPQAMKRYLDSSVSNNIAHSLHRTNDVSSFSEITKYSEEDLSLIVRKTVELYNGTILCDFLNRDLTKVTIDAPISDAIRKATDISKKQLYKNLDRKALAAEYKDIVNLSCNLEKEATDKLILQLTNALFNLNFLSVFETREYNRINGIWMNTQKEEYYIIQPAVKYALLQEAKNILLNSPTLAPLTEMQRTWLSNQLESDILGKMTENIVIFETTRHLDQNRYLVCKPVFRIENQSSGEYDMLVYDKKCNEYYAFEIKHSSEMVSEYSEGKYIGQDKNLRNEELKSVIDANYGNRKNACVLYNGETGVSSVGTNYINIADFLLSLGSVKDLELTVNDIIDCHINNAVCEQNNHTMYFSEEDTADDSEEPKL